MNAQLASYATVRQLEILEAIEKHGSQRKAAKALGVNKNTVDSVVASLKKKAALQGHSPDHDMTRTVPDGFKVKGVSSLYVDGKLSSQWVKSSADEDRRQEMIRSAFDAMAQELPRLAPCAGPDRTIDQLATLYTLTDSHVGMLAWHREAGADWDLEIAESVLTGCFRQMVDGSPPARVGFVNQLGDFLHSDGLVPVTPTSGHVLDQDGRYTKLVETAVRILRRVIGMALEKHEKVVVLMAEGNHDMASSVWLRVMFKALFENEPRVDVIDSPLPYYVYQHGKTMLAFHHGHMKKNDQLPILFASQFPKVWGETTKRYAHTGHRHHTEEKEHSGITVIQHPTLAARDAYAARGGWIAERQVSAITYHAEYGQVARVTVTPEMIQ
jgi:DNA-binding CsgD family transcriptional regulator